MKPMKASAYDPATLKFPVRASPKLDGFRAVGIDGKVLTNSLKPIRNASVQYRLGMREFNGLDGELIVGPASAPDVFSKTSSGVTAAAGEPNFKFYAFDCFDNPDQPYEMRLATLHQKARLFNNVSDSGLVVVLEQVIIRNLEELEEYEAKQVKAGYEGIMIRSLDGRYKFGRSTVKEGFLLKVKRFSHGEAKIVGFNELMHNENESYINELGHTARSSNSENLVSSGLLGSFKVTHPEFADEFDISCGSMTHEQRRWTWDNRALLLDRISRFKWFKHGTKDVPRHGLWAGFRDNEDLGEDHPLYKKGKKPDLELLFPDAE